MNSPCLLVKSVALAEKGNKCNKNRCSRPAPNFGSGPHSQSSMHDGLRWNGETARSLRLRNRNPISVALNAYDNPSPPPHLSVLNYLQMSFKNQLIGVFFHNFGRKLKSWMSDRFCRCATSSETVCHSTCRNCEKKPINWFLMTYVSANNSTNLECVEDFKQSRLWRCLLFTFNVFYFFNSAFFGGCIQLSNFHCKWFQNKEHTSLVVRVF